MLRRRRKPPKPPKPAPAPKHRRARHATAGGHRPPQPPQPAPQAAPRSHRRARPGAEVPPELILTPHPRVAAAPAPGPAGQDAHTPPHGRRRRAGAPVVLVTGFEPFGGQSRNPSWDVCERLPRQIAGLRVETLRVPCVFRRAIEVVTGAIERLQPALVVCLGEAGGRTRVSVERVAINVDDAREPDNAGARPRDEPIAPDGPPACFATLPVKAMVEAVRAAGIPAELSNSAGTYVCNHLMYGVLHFLAAGGNPARAGFIHLPWSEAQAIDKPDAASMALETMARAIEVAIAAALGPQRPGAPAVG